MANSVWVGWLGTARVSTSGNDVTFPGTLSAQGLTLGTNPASAGIIRVPNAQGIRARNSANNADIEMIGTTSSNLVELSGSGASVRSGGILYPVSPLDLGLLASPWANVYATAYHAGTALIVGGSNATYGGVRLKNGSGGEIVARNAIDTGNIQLLGVTASNLIELGNGGFLIRCNEPFYPGGALDLGRVTDPWANVYATAYHAGGTAGIDFNGAVTNLTVVKGIVTAAS